MLEADQNGLSWHEIAELLWSAERVAGEWWADGWMRAVLLKQALGAPPDIQHVPHGGVLCVLAALVWPVAGKLRKAGVHQRCSARAFLTTSFSISALSPATTASRSWRPVPAPPPGRQGGRPGLPQSSGGQELVGANLVRPLAAPVVDVDRPFRHPA